ncbi:phosphatase PAP2 family protein [Halomicrobium sp. IBSBa]|uniref:phosphatase PAP2 family protein n=1 Tax=Halomicrobium sp. IBSBa TaxID=2778916 RepID=UPI001ABF9DBA|nr:phosphatase PAP2 family protein [Halomicrobium sp. IBSBa]MBO4248118.1 phosphatase PAP2 family protein [Halomicrobium sp. IBSBa]
MIRLTALSRSIWEATPGWLIEPAGVVTAFGGATALLFVLSLLYWLDERRSTATVVSYAFVALAVVILLKAAIGMGRPPASVRSIPLANDPYGFPSGHAVAAVVVYGGLATVRDRLDDVRVVAAVALAVALVALSRVVLGMHYLGDVIVGTGLGLVVLAACWRFVGRRPGRGFLVAGVVAVGAVLVTGGSSESILALGGSVGGAVGSRWIDAVSKLRSRLDGAILAAVGVPYALVLDRAGEAVAPPLAAVVYAALVAGILLLPVAVARLPLSADRAASA